MCGISGMFGQPDRGVIGRMAAAMVHRGPDDDGFYVDEHVALGFRRLSIIDVSGGHQPLTNEDHSLMLVFNGEIYNHRGLRKRLESRGHRFRTQSDGEVILHLYEEQGADFINTLNGIFAFALWDRRAQRMLLARDHHGVKPLYWSDQGSTFLFASELKSIIASGKVSREIDPEAVAQYLSYQAVPPPLSILRDVKMLPPGHMMTRTPTSTTITSYWTPIVEHPVTSVEEAKHVALDGLRDAVRRQMMSERPLGVFLSGGVDSSALVALASEHVTQPLKTFSVGFIGADESVLTEWPWARMVAERYGTDHQEVVLTETMFREALPHTFSAMDQPTSDGINSYWVSYAAAQHVTVALSGTGGDELFLGYDRDRRLLDIASLAAPLQNLPAGYVRQVVSMLDRIPDTGLWPAVAKWKQAARAFARLDDEFVSPRTIGIFDTSDREQMLSPELRASQGAFMAPSAYLRADVTPDFANPGAWISRLEQRAYLSYVLLRDIDAMSMAHSLEVRVPFLDPRYTESMARIPTSMKVRDGIGKWVLKQALRELLPDEVLFRTKMGFGLPYNAWMRRSLEPMVRDLLSPDRIRRRGLFDPTATQALLDRFYAGDDGVWRKLWTLFVAEGWASEVLDVSAEARHVAA
jgi:asparagine synthase (glutamine-hydrolysing)